MAIGTVTLDTLRSDLRARIDEITPKKFEDVELNRWLNIGQYEAFMKIKDMNEQWYLTPIDIVIDSADNGEDNFDMNHADYFDTDWVNVHELHYVKATTWASVISAARAIPLVPISQLLEYNKSSLHDTQDPKCSQVGSNLYFSQNIATSDAFTIFYYRKPVNMTSSANLDVPDWAQDLVLMYAYNNCLRKLNRNTEDVDRNISNRLKEIKETYATDIKVDKAEKEPTTVRV